MLSSFISLFSFEVSVAHNLVSEMACCNYYYYYHYYYYLSPLSQSLLVSFRSSAGCIPCTWGIRHTSHSFWSYIKHLIIIIIFIIITIIIIIIRILSNIGQALRRCPRALWSTNIPWGKQLTGFYEYGTSQANGEKKREKTNIWRKLIINNNNNNHNNNDRLLKLCCPYNSRPPVSAYLENKCIFSQWWQFVSNKCSK